MGEAVSPRMRLFPQRVERLFQEIQEIPLAPVVSKNLFNVIEVKELWNVHCPLSLNEIIKLDLAFNNVKPKDRYFVLD